jgi:hypothetical protein
MVYSRSLRVLGLRGRLPQYVESFLSNRKIAVRINTTLSKRYAVHVGVPQGSVISPVLFTIMINDLFSGIPKDIKYSIYADDGALWVNCTKLNEGITLMQQAVDKVILWSQTWGLQLAVAKTKAIIFTKKKVKEPAPIKIGQESIEYVNEIKFLGMTLDRRLTWNKYIFLLKERCQGGLRFMSFVAGRRYGSNFKTLIKIYKSLISPN